MTITQSKCLVNISCSFLSNHQLFLIHSPRYGCASIISKPVECLLILTKTNKLSYGVLLDVGAYVAGVSPFALADIFIRVGKTVLSGALYIILMPVQANFLARHLLLHISTVMELASNSII